MSDPKWTREVPKVAGYFWVKHGEMASWMPRVVSVEQSGGPANVMRGLVVYSNGKPMCHTPLDQLLWSGPITPPAEEVDS